MSRVDDAKKVQGYTRDLVCCGTCKNYSSVIEPSSWDSKYMIEKKRMCRLGKFTVHKKAHCQKFEYKL